MTMPLGMMVCFKSIKEDATSSAVKNSAAARYGVRPNFRNARRNNTAVNISVTMYAGEILFLQ